MITRFVQAYVEAVSETHLVLVGELLKHVSPFARQPIVIQNGEWK